MKIKTRLLYGAASAISFLVYWISPGKVIADGEYSVENPIGKDNLGSFFGSIKGLVTPVAVIGFTFAVFFAGFTRMTAAGNPEKEKKSMAIAISAAVGFAIIALAPLIINFVANFLEVDTAYLGGGGEEE